MASTDSTLYKFLDDPVNSHAKEAVLMHRLCLDLKLVAATGGYYLNTYWDDVDHDGFDLIFDDQDSLMKTQVKSVGAVAATIRWKIHKRILRPTIDQIDKLGFEPSPSGEGVAGGVILIEYRVESDDRLEVNYYYTDLYVLLAFECALIWRKNGNSRNAIVKCLNDLKKGTGREHLTVPRAAFVRAKSPAMLIALLGLHSTHGHSWKFHVTQLVNNIDGDASLPLPKPEQQFKEQFWEEFQMMVGEKDLHGP